jgi:serine/threonine protein kinase
MEKECPLCGETIKAVAVKCRYCQSMLDGTPPPSSVPARESSNFGASASPEWWNLAGPLAVGTSVREYRIERMLGQGGMGEVYLAVDANTDRKVAIKVVPPELMRDEGVRRRFLEEARVMASLEHPSIVTLLAFFEEGGRFFLVMKFIDGESLEERIERQGPLSFGEAERIHGAVRGALDYGHGRPQPVIHRDIKPANILLGRDGRVVVTDFGVAKALGREKMTRTRGVVGTYEYMSPEQVQGDEVTAASDLYALGITLYKMLTGVVPFPQTSETGLECMNAHLAKSATAVSEYREAIPADLTARIKSYLTKDPNRRDLPAPIEQAPPNKPPVRPHTRRPAPVGPVVRQRVDVKASEPTDLSQLTSGTGWLALGVTLILTVSVLGAILWLTFAVLDTPH